MNRRKQYMKYLLLFILVFSCTFLLGQSASEAFSVPGTVTVQAGGSATITLTDPDPAASYTWVLSPSDFGSLSFEGDFPVYSALNVGGTGTITITETVGDSTTEATVTINVLNPLSVTASAQTIIAGENVTLSVTGTTSTALTWTATHGTITGSGTQVTYTGPNDAVDDLVSVMDEVGNSGSITIMVITQLTGVWTTYTCRKDINHFLTDDATLWVSTKGGLINATASTLYTKESGLPANHITATAPDGSGGLWIACRWGGLVHMTGGSAFTIYTTENSDLPSDEITSLVYVSGKGLYIGTMGGGLVKLTFSGGEPVWVIYKKENYTVPTNNISCLSYTSAQGLLWVGTIGGGVARHNPSTGGWESFNQSVYTILPSNDANAVVPDSSGGAWMGTNGHGLVHIPSDYKISVLTQSNSNLKSNTILSLARSAAGVIYAGTLGGGITVINNGQVTGSYTAAGSSLPGDDISAISMNNSGTMNVGVLGKGYGTFNISLKAYAARSTTLGENELPDNDVSVIVRDMNQNASQGLWIGTIGGGLVHADANGTWKEYNQTSTGYDINHVSALFSDNQGGVWIGTEGAGLFHMNAAGTFNAHYDINSGLPANNITDLEEDGTGGIWIGTTLGLVHKDINNNFTIYGAGYTDLPDNYITSLTFDATRGLWVGTFGGGVALYYQNEFSLILKTTNSELPSNYVKATGLYGNVGLWIGIFGGDGGLALRANSGSWAIFTTANSPLPHNWITAIESDGAGGVWIATFGGGILYVDAAGDQANYNIINSESVHNDILTIEPDGESGLWIGYDGGGMAHVSLDNKLLPDSGESPVVSQDTYASGERCRVILESNPDGYDQYIALYFTEAITFNKSFYFIPTTNVYLAFDGINYVPWTGGDLVMDFVVDDTTPKGEYVVYLLRVISGQDPAKTKDWQLGAVLFTIE